MRTDWITAIGIAGALAIACSSQSFTGSGRDGGANGGGSNTGASSGAGGASGNAGSSQAGGAKSGGGGGMTGGAGGTGARPGAGGSVSAGGSRPTGGAPNDSGIISTDGGVVGSDAGAVRCTGTNRTFPTFDKLCSTSADCVLARHTTSCCGSQLFMAINREDLPRFQAAESICDAQYPACGCASQGANAEDGTLVPWGNENLIVASCDNMVCRSHYAGKTFPCGTATCTDQQYCYEFSGGPAGTPTSYDCDPLGSCKSCTCMSLTASSGCTCTENQGFMTVSCAAP